MDGWGGGAVWSVLISHFNHFTAGLGVIVKTAP